MDPIIIKIIVFLALLTLLLFLCDIDMTKICKSGKISFSGVKSFLQASFLKFKALIRAINKSFLKLNPLYALKNPIIFIVEVGAIIITTITFSHAMQFEDYSFNLQLAIWLWITVLCANLVETFAEDKKLPENNQPKKSQVYVNRILRNGKVESVPLVLLRRGDLVVLKKNDTVPCDGVLFQGIALIDESAVGNVSIPVIKDADTDRNILIKGSKVLYGNIKLKITANQAIIFINDFLNSIEKPLKKKTPDDTALDAALIGLTIVFMSIIIFLVIFADYSKVIIATSALIALFVCLLPTTIGGLLPAIGPSSVEVFSKNNLFSNPTTFDNSYEDKPIHSLSKSDSGYDFPSTSPTALALNFYPPQQPSVVAYVNSKIQEANNIFAHKNMNLKLSDDVIRAEAPAIAEFRTIDFEYLLATALNVLGLAKQILVARGNLVIFCLAYDVSKYFAIIPALCASQHPMTGVLSIVQLASIKSAVLSVVMFNALVILLLIPFASPKSVKLKHEVTLKSNIQIYGFLGVLLPFICIKLINILVVYFHWA